MMAWSTDDEYCSMSHNVVTAPEEASDTEMSEALVSGASDAGVILGASDADVGAAGAIFVIS